MKKLTDQELIILLTQGNYQAFTEIYRRFAPLLYSFVRKRVNDKDDAKDILQELFTDFWIKREQVNIKGEITSYLYAAVRYKMIDFIERNATQKRYIDAIEGFKDEEPVMTDHLVRERQLAVLIEKNINQLPKKMREVFLLSRNEQLTYNEIADQLGIEKATVRTHAKGAMKILKDKLKIT